MTVFGFIAPTAYYASFFQRDLDRTWTFNPVSVMIHSVLYVAMHDTFFYQVHALFHKIRPLYEYFHAMHHEFAYAMNVYMVSYAEVPENMIQVGLPWLVWTWIAGSNWWNWLVPLSLIVFTTLAGHSGYRMNWRVALFHPLIMPFVWTTGSYMLTPGDHQMQ
jgi:sterol desaturase/sphingolipid hydroxylase (fatty acid hydroxylase superfamily)